MLKRSQIAVLSTAPSSLASLLLGSFNLDYFLAGVAATDRTSVMRYLGAMALRAIVYRGGR